MLNTVSTKALFKTWRLASTGLLIAIVVVSFCACGKSPKVTLTPSATPTQTLTPTPTLAPTHTPTPTPTFTPTQTSTTTFTPTPTPPPTTTPTPGPQNHQFSGQYVLQSEDSACLKGLSPEAFMLGGDANSCRPSGQSGAVVFSLTTPKTDNVNLVTLRVICPDPSDCASAVVAEKPGNLSLKVDDTALWTAACPKARNCDSLALGSGPAIVFRSDGATRHSISLETSPGTSWIIDRIEWDWTPMPDLIQGIAYSPYRDCQRPGDSENEPTREQIQQDLALLQHMGNAIRTYSSQGLQKSIAIWASEAGLRVSAGAWLDSDREANEKEIESLIELARTIELESVIVGNEVLLRAEHQTNESVESLTDQSGEQLFQKKPGDLAPLTEAELLDYIERVKSQVNVPVTTAETWHILKKHPRIIRAIDYVMVHIYAFWEGVPIEEQPAQHVLNIYKQVQTISQGKPVVIGETGWPAFGYPQHGAIPSPENQRRFMREFLELAQREKIPFYYFAAFDELWKTEGGVGPHWGFMYSDRQNKYDMQNVMFPLIDQSRNTLEITSSLPLSRSLDMPVQDVFYVYSNFSAWDNHFVPSGYMGDWEEPDAGGYMNDCFQWSTNWADRAVKVQYTPDELGWAGVYWQYPENNWGTMPEGYDLRDYAQLRFSAKSDQPGSKVQFFVGGVYTGTYPSSIRYKRYAREADWQGFVSLITEWQEFHIDLVNVNLSHVIDGFAWVADQEHTPDGVTFYLDNIYFDQQPLPTLTPSPTPTATPIPTPTPTPTPDICPGNVSQEIMLQAWGALTVGDLNKALVCTDKAIQWWTAQAKEQQAERDELGICSITPDPTNQAAVEEYLAKYWALNDVATCWYIRGQALERLDRRSEAKIAYKMILDNYLCAFAWDPKGPWFWHIYGAAEGKFNAIP